MARLPTSETGEFRASAVVVGVDLPDVDGLPRTRLMFEFIRDSASALRNIGSSNGFSSFDGGSLESSLWLWMRFCSIYALTTATSSKW